MPEDIDEWTIEDLRGLVVNPAPAFPAESPETKLQVTLADFRGYLESVGNPYRYLTANRPAAGGCNGDGGTSSSAQDTPSLAGGTGRAGARKALEENNTRQTHYGMGRTGRAVGKVGEPGG